MGSRFEELWREISVLLESAAAEVEGTSHSTNFRDYLDHNELELALDELVQAGEAVMVSSMYWLRLLEAAQLMNLEGHVSEIREKLIQEDLLE